MALNHQEPDRIPVDVGGMAQSGILLAAYANVRRYLGLGEVELERKTVLWQRGRMARDNWPANVETWKTYLRSKEEE